MQKGCFSENKSLFELISKDKKIMSIINEKKLRSIFDYSSHFKRVNIIFKRVFK
jgi:Adenylosuccinate lyase